MTPKPKFLKISLPSTMRSRAAANAARPSVVRTRRFGRLDYSEPFTMPRRVPVADRPDGPQTITYTRRSAAAANTQEEQ